MSAIYPITCNECGEVAAAEADADRRKTDPSSDLY